MALPPFFQDNPADLRRVADLLRTGEIVALPTETVYGLAADALNETAVRAVFSAKGRPLIDPLIVHARTLADVARIAETTPLLEKLAERFWPGPLTVILKKKPIVPALVTAGEPTVAVRLPAHPLMRRVLELSGLLLAAPSANPFGYISPTRAEHVRASLGEKVPWILDGGTCRHGLESTIVHLADPEGPRILRPGPVSREALESVSGVPVAVGVGFLDQKKAQIAPGLLERHYSPRTPLILHEAGTIPGDVSGANMAVVWQRRPTTPLTSESHFWLSEDGNLEEIGRNLFGLLRRLDEGNFTAIHLELTDGSGLGLAINDRLRRAAAKR